MQAFTELNTQSKVTFKFKLFGINSSVFHDFCPAVAQNRQFKSFYYRLLLGRYLDPSLSQVLYLDLDIFLLTDIRKLFKQYAPSNPLLGAVTTPVGFLLSNVDKDHLQYHIIQIKPRRAQEPILTIKVQEYINSGVLLFNLDEWRKQDIERKVFDLGSKYDFPVFDQDIFNVLGQGQTLFMDWGWNLSLGIVRQYVSQGLTIRNESEKYKLKNEELPLCKGAPGVKDLSKKIINPYLVHFSQCNPWDINFISEVMNFTDIYCKVWIDFRKQWLAMYRRISPMYRRVKQLNL